MSRLLSKILLTLLLFVFGVTHAAAMTRFIVSVENQRMDGPVFHFDISIFNISESDLYLSESDFVLCFNNANFISAPTISATHPNDEVLDWYDYDAQVTQGNIIFIALISPQIESGEELESRAIKIPAMEERVVCQVKLDRVSVSEGTTDLCWNNGDLFKSTISEYEQQDPFTPRFVEVEGNFKAPESFAFEGVTTSDVKDVEAPVSLRLYPQPAVDYIMVELPARTRPAVLEIRDMRGALEQIIHLPVSSAGEMRIDVGSLPAGVYQARLLDRDRGLTLASRSFVVLN